MALDGHLLADLVGEPVRVGVQVLGIPLVGGIAEHEALVSSTEVVLLLLLVHSVGDFSGLRLDVEDHVHIVAVETDLRCIVANTDADVSCDLLEIHLFLGDTCFAE